MAHKLEKCSLLWGMSQRPQIVCRLRSAECGCLVLCWDGFWAASGLGSKEGWEQRLPWTGRDISPFLAWEQLQHKCWQMWQRCEQRTSRVLGSKSLTPQEGVGKSSSIHSTSCGLSQVTDLALQGWRGFSRWQKRTKEAVLAAESTYTCTHLETRNMGLDNWWEIRMVQ